MRAHKRAYFSGVRYASADDTIDKGLARKKFKTSGGAAMESLSAQSINLCHMGVATYADLGERCNVFVFVSGGSRWWGICTWHALGLDYWHTVCLAKYCI